MFIQAYTPMIATISFVTTDGTGEAKIMGYTHKAAINVRSTFGATVTKY